MAIYSLDSGIAASCPCPCSLVSSSEILIVWMFSSIYPCFQGCVVPSLLVQVDVVSPVAVPPVWVPVRPPGEDCVVLVAD